MIQKKRHGKVKALSLAFVLAGGYGVYHFGFAERPEPTVAVVAEPAPEPVQAAPEAPPLSPPAAETVAVEETPPVDPVIALNTINQLTYRFRDQAQGCKVDGVSDPKLAAALAARILSRQSDYLNGQLFSNKLWLDPENKAAGFFGDEEAAALFGFFQENGILPLVEITGDDSRGAAFFNTGGNKNLVIYVSRKTPDENNKDGTGIDFIANQDEIIKFVNTVKETMHTEKGVHVLHLDRFNTMQPEWKIHRFAPGATAPFEVLAGVRESRLAVPARPCP